MTLTWEDPPVPAPRRGRGKFDPDEVIKELKQKPDTWAIVPGTEGVSASYGTISPLVKRLKADGAVVEVHSVKNKRKVYAKFTPEQAAA